MLPGKETPAVIKKMTGQPAFVAAINIVWFSFRSLLTQKPGQILFSAIFLLVLWGGHGRLELLQKLWPAYQGPGYKPGMVRPQLVQGLPWDHEIISFWGGFLLVVVVPALIIRFGFKEKLSDYGLGWPLKEKRPLALASFLLLMAVSAPAFILAAKEEGMRSLYPFYRPFSSTGQFLLYELCYFPFFVAVEFIFRGYMQFGLARSVSGKAGELKDGFAARYFFSRYAILVPVLPYIAWHLGKPLPELWGTLFWGVAAGALAHAVRSLWPVIFAHWLLNVLLDGIVAGVF